MRRRKREGRKFNRICRPIIRDNKYTCNKQITLYTSGNYENQLFLNNRLDSIITINIYLFILFIFYIFCLSINHALC